MLVDSVLRPPSTSLLDLPGIGPKRAVLLERLGIRSVRDLAFHAPRAWRDLRRIRRVADLAAGGLAARAESTVRVRFRRGSVVRKGGRPFYRALFEDDSGRVDAVWFGAPYLRKRFARGAEYLLIGKAARGAGGKRPLLAHPEIEEAEESEGSLHVGRLVPVYPATEGLSQRTLRAAVAAAIERAEPSWDWLPSETAARELQPALVAALSSLHFPADPARASAARRALAWREAFLLHAALLRERRGRERLPAPPIAVSDAVDRRIRARLPFALRRDQERAVREIRADLERAWPMRRILSGDVGSGKTAVALYACLAAVASGRRAAILCPTTVLAEQHVRTLSRWLSGSRVRLALASAGRGAAGEADLVVGTHALLSEGIETFALLVVDEQHRFGVAERALLPERQAARGAFSPHQLEMSATPIPRTLLGILQGAVDLSVLGSPVGRRVRTERVSGRKRASVWAAIRREAAQGGQAYVVCPRIEGEKGERSALEVHRELSEGPLRNLAVGLAHGRMDAAEKEAALRAFAGGRTQVLVATTLVEVGLDVPAATMIAIEEAHRFGLAALHQLRGRVGRGERPGTCWLLGEPESPEGESRLAALCAASDGARLSELDLASRGSGDWFGAAQSGLFAFLRLLDPLRDRGILAAARTAALRWAEDGGAWTPALEAELSRRTGPEPA